MMVVIITLVLSLFIMILFINISKGYKLQMEYKMNTEKSHSCYMSENTI